MTKEILKMTIKEADRLGTMRQIDKKKLNIRRASEQMGVSFRQAKRIRKRYLIQGEEGLISRKRGLPSGNKISEEIRCKIMTLVQDKYVDFGPTLASEKLKERDKIILSEETLRKWMIEAGL